MAGFREPESTVTLRFKPGHQLHGLEATVRSLSIDEYATAMGWHGNEPWSDGETLDRFHKELVSWNLTDRSDQPIPISESPNRDNRLIRQLNQAWIQAMVEVHDSDPLSDSSSSGETSQAPPIPMAPLSQSQAS